MGLRQPARLSPRPVYGLPDRAVSDERARLGSGVLPLLVLVVALAAATVWYVALPALDTRPSARRSCEVVFLASGKTRCVPNPGSQAVSGKPKLSRRAKH
jgi:hypothetical protein